MASAKTRIYKYFLVLELWGVQEDPLLVWRRTLSRWQMPCPLGYYQADAMSTRLPPENPRTTLLELEQDTGISKTTIGRIVTEDLKLKKTPAKFIPRFLTNEQKLCRLATCEDMMEMTRTDPEWKDKIITGDETWVYGYDPETKPQLPSGEVRAMIIMGSLVDMASARALQSWIFGHDLEDNALAIMASAKTRIYKYFLVLELWGVQEDPLLVWRRTLSRWQMPCPLGYYQADAMSTRLPPENPRTTLLELEQDTGISKTTIGRIVTEDLKLKKTPAKFIPRFLTNEQKLCRLATCEDMMEMTRTDPEWKDKIITGDETWVYGYDPETKPQLPSGEVRAMIIMMFQMESRDFPVFQLY
ncbi:hypothetical protein LAZ67_23002088 [Cordylochernes scorpioides]|uniref:Uncharacterized protein n=1 Tax=Cordylochernes scorpioides TaxID=51811 RepID=A0ABY6LVC9_9ARAC|nr:hypothetical protein LAZ67_23002088 [Cordylochernes scorpioides]